MKSSTVTAAILTVTAFVVGTATGVILQEAQRGPVEPVYVVQASPPVTSAAVVVVVENATVPPCTPWSPASHTSAPSNPCPQPS